MPRKGCTKRRNESVQSLTDAEDSDVVNAVARDARVDELTQKVRELSEEISCLRGAQGQGDCGSSVTRDKADIVCWSCRGRGHIRRNCPQRGRLSTSRRSGRTRTGVNTAAVNSVLLINGAVAGHPMPMLVDTGSGITIIREDVWQEVVTKDAHQFLGEITHPVFVANGEELDVAGRAAVTLSI